MTIPDYSKSMYLAKEIKMTQPIYDSATHLFVYVDWLYIEERKKLNVANQLFPIPVISP